MKQRETYLWVYIHFIFHISQPHNRHLLSQGQPLSAAPLGSHLGMVPILGWFPSWAGSHLGPEI